MNDTLAPTPCAAFVGPRLNGDPRAICGLDSVAYKTVRLATPAFQESGVIVIIGLCGLHDELSRKNAPPPRGLAL